MLGRRIDRLAGALVGGVLHLRNHAYDRNLLRAKTQPGVAVISVGNLAMGGSGKTPFVCCLAALLRDAGHPTAVLLRGYGGRMARRGARVSDGDRRLETARDAGDEAVLLADRLRGVSVWAGADRAARIAEAAGAGAEVIILDDGFQHRAVHRDLDILLAKPADLRADTPLFPAGDLREPPRFAARADLIGGFADEWSTETGQRPDFTFETVPEHILDASGARRAPETLAGRRVFLVAAIARPMRFAHTVHALGAHVTGMRFLRDHHCLPRRLLSRIRTEARTTGAELLLATEKDWVRTDHWVEPGPVPVGCLVVGLRVASGLETLSRALDTVLPSRPRPSGSRLNT